MTNEEAKSIISNIDKAYRTFSKEEIQALEKAIKALEQEPCEDCISRAEVKRIINFYRVQLDGIFRVNESIDNLPSIQPKPKAGYWIHRNDDFNDWLECSECEYGSDGEVKIGAETPFCPLCGAKMLPTDLQFGDQDTLMSAT